jgi:hypothetical protein
VTISQRRAALSRHILASSGEVVGLIDTNGITGAEPNVISHLYYFRSAAAIVVVGDSISHAHSRASQDFSRSRPGLLLL